MQCDYTSSWAVCFQEWPEICIFVPRVRRTFLMWLWSLRMVSGWRRTRWSWLPPAASVWQKIAKTNIRTHWSLWEEFRAISNTVGTFDFWRTLSLHLIQILSATFYAFSCFWSGVNGGIPIRVSPNGGGPQTYFFCEMKTTALAHSAQGHQSCVAHTLAKPNLSVPPALVWGH